MFSREKAEKTGLGGRHRGGEAAKAEFLSSVGPGRQGPRFLLYGGIGAGGAQD